MGECLAIRHVAFEDLGLLAPLLAERDLAVRYLDAGVDPIDAETLLAPDIVVVLGGPIGVYQEDVYPWLTAETAAIAARLAADKATLGICLGAQLMAKALGAHVGPGPGKEIGYAPIDLTIAGRAILSDFAKTPVLHWHGDAFDLPAGAVKLASTKLCPNQAFAIGPKILGLQFHVEVDPARLETWLIGHTAELGASGIDPRELRRQAAAHGLATASQGRAMLAGWLDGALSDWKEE